MKKTNFRSMTIAVLMVALALVLSFAIGSLAPFATASAVEYEPTEIFSSGANSSVSSSDDGGTSYVRFGHAKDDSSVYFRRNLALKWFTAEGEDYFSMTLKFPQVNFTTYSINFESAEENISKEETAKNAIVFTSGSDGTTVAVKDAEHQDDDVEGVAVDLSGDVEISLADSDGEVGEYDVKINGQTVGTFTNIGGNYIEYFSSATSTPRTPMTLTADKLSGSEAQDVLIKQLNGQSFALNAAGEIVDDAAPVLVVNEDVYALRLGSRFSLSYEAIDVCDSSVTVTRQYYMAAASENGEYLLPTDDDYKTLTTSTTFLPTDDKGEEVQYVSIRFALNDGRTTTDDKDEHVYLSWYAVENAVQTLGTGDNAHEYIVVNRETGGPHYVGLEARSTVEDGVPSGENVKIGTDENDVDGDGDTSEALLDALAEAFQANVNEEAAKRSAGDGSYFYVPSLRGLIASNYTDYRNLTFNIYYYHQSQSVSDSAKSATSLDYNELRFEIEKPGTYVFRVVANAGSDANMQYYVDGRLVNVTSSNIWDIDEIPEFRFTVRYDGAVIEDAEEQELGYRGQEYKISDFDVVAVSGYESEYKLYLLDEANIPENLRNYSYSALVKDAEHYFGENGTLREYLKEISKYRDDVDEDDTAAWARTDNDYHWEPDSKRFTPVEAGYYIVELTVNDAIIPNYSVSGYQVIDARNPIDTLPDATYWLENNVTSVVLFSISGVLFIVVVILFVARPSDKKIDEVDLEKLKGQKKNVKKD